VNSISVDDDWSAVPGITGYRGDGLGNGPGADPRTIAADGASTPVDVIANRTNPAALLVGGVAEFELHDSVVALQPTSTADAPHLVLRVDTTGLGSITVAYNVRDVDASIDNAAQPVALQYRVGGRGAYANVRGSFVADATSGPRLATLVTPVRAVVPPAAADKPLVEVRIITADARYSDEWVGIDDISINAVNATVALRVGRCAAEAGTRSPLRNSRQRSCRRARSRADRARAHGAARAAARAPGRRRTLCDLASSEGHAHDRDDALAQRAPQARSASDVPADPARDGDGQSRKRGARSADDRRVALTPSEAGLRRGAPHEGAPPTFVIKLSPGKFGMN
jgi:hypothetical protein